jgi:chaperonin GroES
MSDVSSGKSRAICRILQLRSLNARSVGLVFQQNPVFGVEMANEYVEPLGMRVLIRKDEARQETRGGIVLPDTSEIPTITGRVVEISVQIDRDEDFPIRKYDKVLFHPKNAIPVDFEADNLLFVVPVEDIVAVFRKPAKGSSRQESLSDAADEDE